MSKPNRNCKKCGSPFYAAPSHIEKGWGKFCSLQCRSGKENNSRWVESDETCKGCGKSFHVKPSHKMNGKGRKYCSDECRYKSTRAIKTCPVCGEKFHTPNSHRHKKKHCSDKCLQSTYLNSTPNSECFTCKKKFYVKPYELKRTPTAGTFCSVECMSGGRNKVRWKDGKHISSLELGVAEIIERNKLEYGMEREIAFHPERRWRFDFAWPDKKIAIEVHGAIWSGKSGGHTSGKGRLRDMEKLNEAALLGWTVLEIGSVHIINGDAEKWIKQILA